MKILHVYKDFDPPVHGGMERHMALMCRFQRQWAEVEALTCSRSWRSRRVLRDDIPVTEVAELGRFQSAPVSPLFPLYLRRKRADVIVVHTPNPTAELAWLMARPGGTLVVRYQSDVVRQKTAMRVYKPFQMKFLDRADMILPSSQQYLDTSEILRPFRSRCRVVPLGILPEEFESVDPDEVDSTQERYGGRFVFFSGKHRYYKGLEYLVRATARIEAPVVIAGDGPERSRCMSLAKELGVKVFFSGALPDAALRAHLHACEVFVFPSVERSEAFGLSMLEAHACGKPVVATQLGTGVEFANLDGKTGLNVPPRDPQALADAVNTLLNDATQRSELGKFARERVRKELHAERIARAEFDLYREVVG